MKKIKICVLGADGQLGREFRSLYPSYEYMYFDFFTKSQCDIANETQVGSVLQSGNYDFVINCAAYTAVDKAENDKEKCMAINTDGCRYICQAIKEKNTRLIHFSTDYVYHFYNGFPIKETDTTQPLGVYATSKLEGEIIIRQSQVPALILRTSWVISSFGHNFVKTILKIAQEKKSLHVVNDQFGTLTYAKHLAIAVLDIITMTATSEEYNHAFNQTYNFSSEGITTWYDIALKIIEESSIDCQIHPVFSSEYPTAAVRPTWSVLAKNKIRAAFGLEIPHWYKALKECLSEISK